MKEMGGVGVKEMGGGVGVKEMGGGVGEWKIGIAQWKSCLLHSL